MAMQKTAMGMVLAIAVISLAVSALGALVATRTISNSGTMRVVTPPPSPSPSPPPAPAPTVQLGIYSDSGCTTALSSIPWGTLDPGSSVTQTIYMRNEGNVPVTLSVQAVNWNPASVSSYFTLTWDRSGYVLAAGSVVQATLNLTVSASISGITNFSFDITITATQ